MSRHKKRKGRRGRSGESPATVFDKDSSVTKLSEAVAETAAKAEAKRRDGDFVPKPRAVRRYERYSNMR